MADKLIIDMAKIKALDEGAIECSYKHHPANKGFKKLFEKINFVLVCRKCESAPCVYGCPRKALEKVDDERGNTGVLRRASMLCTGCGTCAMACPFGTIYPDLILFTDDVCDLCRGRLSPGEKPLCVQTSENGAVDYHDIECGEDMVEVFDGIIAKVPQGSLWKPFLREIER
jgi:Fe-S-cluster-containing dehydrogenase component